MMAYADSLRSLDLSYFRMHFEEAAFGLFTANQYELIVFTKAIRRFRMGALPVC